MRRVEATERQFVDLMRAASSRVVVRLQLFSIPEVPRADAVRQELGERYRDIAEFWDSHIDGLIVTGTEPRARNLKDEPYWNTLSQVVDWASDHTTSAIWSCLAAHAAVLRTDGIERAACCRQSIRHFRLRDGRAASDDNRRGGGPACSAFALQRLVRTGACRKRLSHSHARRQCRRRYVRPAGAELSHLPSGPPGIRCRRRCCANIAATSAVI